MSNEHVNATVRPMMDTICPPVERDMRPIAAAIAPLATMGQPVKTVVYPIAEVSDDQNTATVTKRLEFVEEPKYRCMNCAADNNDKLCDELPCGPRSRTDGRLGYFREVRG
jgi:hypothetical protein